MSTPPALRDRLQGLARASICHGLKRACPLDVDPGEWPSVARQKRATFVTVHHNGDLRGCVGALEASRSLAQDVAANAFAAAFRDPRFAPLAESEFPGIEIHISLLSPIEPLTAASESELLGELRPGIDGLILEDGARRATFLPAVWHKVPEAGAFLAQLKAKAGFPADRWSESIRVYRYTAEEF